MNKLPVSIYHGHIFDANAAAIIPNNPDDLGAIWCFCSSNEFHDAVRAIDKKMNVMNHTLLKVPFDFEYWKSIADERYPDGVPEPYSDEPTQWLFHGHPAHTIPGTELHVALARLAGFRWPAEIDTDMRLAPLARERATAAAALAGADANGLLTLHGAGTDKPLADQLRDLLACAYDEAWSNTRELALIRAADALLDKKEFKDATLEGWLRDRAFRQHCVLFYQRPFLWQVWDGGKGGFSAFLHYHRLNRAALEKLTYTLLGDWTARMKAEGRAAEEGWALQLGLSGSLCLGRYDAAEGAIACRDANSLPSRMSC
ncbi:hypothetical protein ACFQU2_04060 [Siccirubricoccus deserti]